MQAAFLHTPVLNRPHVIPEALRPRMSLQLPGITTMRRLIAPLMLLHPLVASAANVDGQIDPTYGESDGRTAIGYLESDSPDLRAISRLATNGKFWLFSDDAEDASAVYIARLMPGGQPDPSFGPNGDGRRRITLPLALVPQTEALKVTSVVTQSNGNPVFAGGLYATGNDVGAFPAVVCRLVAAGTPDGTYDGDGCQTIRSFLAPDETCSVTDLAIDSANLVIAVGNCTAPSIGERPFIARLTTAGAFDVEFNGGIGVVFPEPPLASINHQHYAAVVALPDGRIAVLGEFALASNGIRDYELGILRFDNGGGYDAAFANAGALPVSFDLGGDNHDRARDLALRADGRLLALGEARRADTAQTTALMVQVLDSGARDMSFGPLGQRTDDADGLLGGNANVTSLELDDLGRSVVALSDVSVSATAHTHFGTEFDFGFIPSVPPEALARLRITATVAASGTVDSPHIPNPIPFSVVPGTVTTVSLPESIHAIGDNDAISARAVHISATAPISVVAMNGRLFSTDTSLLMPTALLGTRYRLMSWGLGLGRGSEFSVVASAFNTSVTIIPSVTVAGRPGGVPYNIELQPGEVYHLGDLAGDDVDLSGTRIIANKPVAVSSGNACANVPNIDTDFCDLAFEQQIPVERWGTSFFAVPNSGRPAVVRVLADHSPTLVWIDGVLVATLQGGTTYDSTITTAKTVVTSHPASAAQFEVGCKFQNNDPDCIGDASMRTLEPVSRWGSDYLVTVPLRINQEAPTQSFVRIVTPASSAHQVFIDNVQVPPASFAPIGSSGFAAVQLARAPGVYRITGSTPISVSVGAPSGSENMTHNGAIVSIVAGQAQSTAPSADDLILRLRANGTRDTDFGIGGLALFDHTVLSGGNQNSHDRIVRAIPWLDSIVAGTGFVSPVSAQHLPVTYRLRSGGLFKDGFE